MSEVKEMRKVETPECDKILKVREQSRVIGEFLEYMRERDYEVCEFTEDEEYVPTRMTIEQMIALFYEIDLVKAEEERTALLDAVREANQ